MLWSCECTCVCAPTCGGLRLMSQVVDHFPVSTLRQNLTEPCVWHLGESGWPAGSGDPLPLPPMCRYYRRAGCHVLPVLHGFQGSKSRSQFQAVDPLGRHPSLTNKSSDYEFQVSMIENMSSVWWRVSVPVSDLPSLTFNVLQLSSFTIRGKESRL